MASAGFEPAIPATKGRQTYALKSMAAGIGGKGVLILWLVKGKAISVTGLERSRVYQEVEVPRFHDSRHMKVVRLSALRTGRFHPRGNIPGTHFYRGWVVPRATVRPEILREWKIPMIPSGKEPATFRLVAKCLSKLGHRLPRIISRGMK